MSCALNVCFLLLIINSVQGNNLCVEDTQTTVTCSAVKQIEDFQSQTAQIIQVKGSEDKTNSVLKSNTFVKLPNLETITIYGAINEIVPGAFNRLEKLATITISKSGLTELKPGTFHNIKNIKEVVISTSLIEKISTGIFERILLKKLYLQHSKISVIEKNAFSGMKNLKFFSLTGNLLKTFEPAVIMGATPTLSRLWLNQNQIEKITTTTFTGLPNVQQLYLGHNKIKTIEPASFNGFRNLYKIFLSHNDLEAIEPNVFPIAGLEKMMALDIANNNLTYLSNGVLVRLPNLEYIALGGNPWQCPCLNILLTWVGDENIKHFPCDKEYIDGVRPFCANSLTKPNTCVNDIEFGREVIQHYKQSLESYPEMDECVLKL